MISIEYKDLPSVLKLNVVEENILLAYVIKKSGNIVLWVINDAIERRDELEFSQSENRLLSLDERKNVRPKSEEIHFSDLGVKVIVTYDFESETNVLHEHIGILLIDSNSELTKISRVYYSPYKDTLEKEVHQALDKYNFPSKYQGFSYDEKINHWVGKMYRFRRQVGESGCEENDAFDSILVKNMKDVDPCIFDILPYCLKKLADLEQLNADELISIFEKKTGYKLI